MSNETLVSFTRTDDLFFLACFLYLKQSEVYSIPVLFPHLNLHEAMFALYVCHFGIGIIQVYNKQPWLICCGVVIDCQYLCTEIQMVHMSQVFVKCLH